VSAFWQMLEYIKSGHGCFLSQPSYYMIPVYITNTNTTEILLMYISSSILSHTVHVSLNSRFMR